ncbi:MAG: 2-oxoisovalerate dehydrogenase E1 subunit beta [Thermoguttaceae bacterium]
MIEESSDAGYEARALTAPIFSEADTLDELRTMIRDAVVCHFDEADRPRIIRLHFVREEVIAT